MKTKNSIFICLLLLVALNLFAQDKIFPTNFSIINESFLVNDKPFVIRCGEMHFARITRPFIKNSIVNGKSGERGENLI